MGALMADGNGSAGFHCVVDSITKDQWHDIVAKFDDASIHQTWSFGAFRWGEEKLSHLVLYENAEIVAAAQVIIVSVPQLKAGIAHCKFGPMWRLRGKAERSEIYAKMLQAMRDEYAGRRGLLLRIKPWETDDPDGQYRAVRESSGLQRQLKLPEYDTFVIDMSRSVEELRAGFSQKWRYNLKKATKKKLVVSRANDKQAAQVFMDLYAEMRGLKSFVDTSEVDLLMALIEDLPAALKPTILTATQDERPAASIVVSSIGQTSHYLFGATGDIGRKTGASYLLFWDALNWLKEGDCRWFDLVGSRPQGTGGGVSYRRFKAGLTGKNGEEFHMSDWEVCDRLRSKLVVHGGTMLRWQIRGIRHQINAAKERLRRGDA